MMIRDNQFYFFDYRQ